jgi:mono/diheme cytochrome c family protein
LAILLLSFWAAASLYAAEILPEQMTAGQKLYRTRCAKCHKMYDPSKYTDQQWVSWMAKMSKKAKLQPAQKQAVADYVQNELRQPAKDRQKATATIAPQ